AIGADAGLQLDEGADIAVKTGQRTQGNAGDGIADGRVGALQLGPGRLHLHGCGSGPNLQDDVVGCGQADLDVLGGNFSLSKSGFVHGEVVSAWGYVGEGVP